MRALLTALALLLAVTGCSSESPSADPTPSSSPSPTASPTPPQRPRLAECRQLDYAAAIAPSDSSPRVSCTQPHTAMTIYVGDQVDSSTRQSRICNRALDDFLGGTTTDRRLSMLHTVWFTPSPSEAEAGAAWLRCDVIAVAGDDDLARLTGRLRGVLDRPEARSVYAMCGTAEPGTPSFERVVCSRRHSWVALSDVELTGRRYPGVAAVREAGQTPCKSAAADRADDPFNYRWGYEWPTAAQWSAGQHYGICWTPS